MKLLKKHIKQHFQLEFDNEQLLVEAFTHASYANDYRHLTKQPLKNLERLEFLGDAVIELAVSDYLFTHFHALPEGQLTRMRASIVRAESLAQLAKECDLASFILLGKGEEKSNGRERLSLLCDVFEAFVGAIYKDQGFAEVKRFLELVMFSKMAGDNAFYGMDYKTRLQEYLQQNGDVVIDYIVTDISGPDHDRQFTTQVTVDGTLYGTGQGKSKKIAEQEAAKMALNQLVV